MLPPQVSRASTEHHHHHLSSFVHGTLSLSLHSHHHRANQQPRDSRGLLGSKCSAQRHESRRSLLGTRSNVKNSCKLRALLRSGLFLTTSGILWSIGTRKNHLRMKMTHIECRAAARPHWSPTCASGEPKMATSTAPHCGLENERQVECGANHRHRSSSFRGALSVVLSWSCPSQTQSPHGGSGQAISGG